MPAEDFLDGPYLDLLNALETSLSKHIANTDPKNGPFREAVFFQIDHGTGHMQRVRGNMEILLRALAFKLEPHEYFVALAAASLHDLGMHMGWMVLDPNIHDPPNHEEMKKIRDNHARIGAEWLRRLSTYHPPEELNILPSQLGYLTEERLIMQLAFVIEAHGKRVEDLKLELNKQFAQDYELRQRTALLSSLLVVADAFDMDQKRVPLERMMASIRSLQGKPSIISMDKRDIFRYLMVYYCQSGQLTAVSNGFLLFELKLAMPGLMLEEDYTSFRKKLLDHYRRRLRPDNTYHSGILNNAGIQFLDINIPEFVYDGLMNPLDVEIMKMLMAEENNKDTIVPPSAAHPVSSSTNLLQLWNPDPVDLRFPAPSILLRPENQIVPFHKQREGLRDELIKWADDGEVKLPLRLYVGPGGVGKTRLFLEVCDRLRQKGWQAGFLHETLNQEWQQEVTDLLAAGNSLFVVCDYAETRRLEVIALLDALLKTQQNSFRVILLARSAGEWWDDLVMDANKNSPTEGLLRYSSSQGLHSVPAMATDGEERVKLFQEALATFAEKLGKKYPQGEPPNLDQDHFSQVLYIHMAAMAFLLDGKTLENETEILDATLDHEEEYWRRASTGKSLTDPLHKSLSQSVALFTLMGSTDSGGQARYIIGKVPLLQKKLGDHGKIYTLLHQFYPNEGGVGPLEPDILGEWHVLRQAKKDDHLLDAALDSSNPTDRRCKHALTVLTRLAARYPAKEELLKIKLRKFLSMRYQQIIDVALETGDPIGRITAEILNGKNDIKISEPLASKIPLSTISLRELGYVTAKINYDHYKSKRLSERYIPLSDVLITRMHAIGKYSESLELIEDAIKYDKEFFEKNRTEQSLINYLISKKKKANTCSALGDSAGALNVLKEVIAIAESMLDKFDSGIIKLYLSSTYHDLSLTYYNLGMFEEGISSANKSFELYAPINHTLFNSNNSIGKLYYSLGNRLSETGNFYNSVTSFIAGINAIHNDYLQKPDRHYIDLTSALLDIAYMLIRNNILNKSFKLVYFAMDMISICYKVRPQIFKVDYCNAKIILCDFLIRTKKYNDSIMVADEILLVSNELHKIRPLDAQRIILNACYLKSLAFIEMKQYPEARESLTTAITLAKEMAEKIPLRWEPFLSECLVLQARYQHATGERQQATKSLDQAYNLLAPHFQKRQRGLFHKMRKLMDVNLAITGHSMDGEALEKVLEAEEMLRQDVARAEALPGFADLVNLRINGQPIKLLK